MSSEQTPTTRKPRLRARTGLVAVGAFVLGGLILPNLRFHVSWREPDSQAQGTGLSVTPAPAPVALSEAEYYARAAQAASPAVVNIDMQQQVRSRRGFMDDDWMLNAEPQLRTTEGSGVIIDNKGYILTNEHVVGPANETGKSIQVSLMDGRRFRGTVVGADKTTDVALVKIDGDKLPVAKIGTARGLVPGQMAVAIGNPLGFRFTVTHGVISALGRPIRDYENLIQIDCTSPSNIKASVVDLQGGAA